jgi:hypothetical protein
LNFIADYSINFLHIDYFPAFDVPPQEVLTKDSVTVSVDAVVYYRVSLICSATFFNQIPMRNCLRRKIYIK